MNRIIWAVLAATFLVVGGLAVRKYAVPALVRGMEISRAKMSARVEEALKAQLQASGVPVAGAPATPAGAPKDTDRAKEAAALQQRREQAELERKLSGDPTPRVETIAATSDNRLCAVIRDALVYEGDTVEGCRVQKVNTNSVEVEKDGKVWVQRLN
jgi:hypothetical protein